jgi:hypothetical protein
MAGTLSVQQIQGLASAADPTTVTIPAGHKLIAPGHVVQVVSNFITTDFNTTSTSFVSTGLSASITPSSTSSKVFVIMSMPSWYIGADNAYATVFRGSTNIGNGDYGLMMVYNTAVYAPSTTQVMDSPSSTSSLTYTVHVRSVGGSTTYASYPTYGHHTITVMEIAQ